MTDSNLVTSWRQYLVEPDAGLHLADTSHPLQLFIGKIESGAPRLVIRSVSKPVQPVLSNVVFIERFEDNSGKWNLSFTLQDVSFTEVFLRLTDDLHARSRTAPNSKAALDQVNVVIDEWRRLLRPKPPGLLSMEELRGLVGELWLLHEVFSKERSIAAAIEGWLGPLGLPQDFWYEEDGFHEAKSIGPGSSYIKISSERQLDVEELQLLVLVVGNTSEQSPAAFNLPTLVDRIKTALSDSSASLIPFSDRLERIGVSLSEPFYHETWFSVADIISYDAAPPFPSVKASALPVGVNRVSYQLRLSDLNAFIRNHGRLI